MPESRRKLLTAFFGAAGVLAVQPLLAGLQAPPPGSGAAPRAKTYPNGRDPNATNIDEPSLPDPKAIEQENQRKLRADVSKLYEMAADLKTDVEKTDATSTLSISVIKKAQDIEKLAKQIRSLAKGLN